MLLVLGFGKAGKANGAIKAVIDMNVGDKLVRTRPPLFLPLTRFPPPCSVFCIHHPVYLSLATPPSSLHSLSASPPTAVVDGRDAATYPSLSLSPVIRLSSHGSLLLSSSPLGSGGALDSMLPPTAGRAGWLGNRMIWSIWFTLQPY